MIDIGFVIMILLFFAYYFAVLYFEKRIIKDPAEIIEKIWNIVLLYAGFSLIWYSVTGKPFLTDTVESYFIYIFIIGFVSILMTIPNLLKEFAFFRKFMKHAKKRAPKIPE